MGGGEGVVEWKGRKGTKKKKKGGTWKKRMWGRKGGKFKKKMKKRNPHLFFCPSSTAPQSPFIFPFPPPHFPLPHFLPPPHPFFPQLFFLFLSTRIKNGCKTAIHFHFPNENIHNREKKGKKKPDFFYCENLGGWG